MQDNNQIISFDNNKVWEHTEHNIKTIFKKTNDMEVKNLMNAKEFLKNSKIIVNGINYTINVPDVIDWNNLSQTLHMTFCPGQNMELLLRDTKQRNQYIPLFQTIFMFMFKEGFYWQDFAPRNILIQSTNISLVDFEKGLNFGNQNLIKFLRDHVYEEYSSFLLRDERLLNPSSIFNATTKEKKEHITIDSIEVKRFRAIAKALNYPAIITYEQYLYIQYLIINAETPYYVNEDIVFPRIKLENILQNKQRNPQAYMDYALEVVKNTKNKNITNRDSFSK